MPKGKKGTNALNQLEKFKCVREMLDSLSLLTNSQATRNSYRLGLKTFMDLMKINDLDRMIANLKNPDIKGVVSADEIYQNFAIKLTKSGYAPKTIQGWLCPIKKLFVDNEIPLKKRHPLKTFTIHESVLPSCEQLAGILRLADLRSRTATLILASSGLRLGELLKLTLSDVDLTKDPPTVRIKAVNAKGRKGRLTFISTEARKSLEAYLEKRRSLGHDLGPSTPIIATDEGLSMTSQNLYQIIMNPIRIRVSKKKEQVNGEVSKDVGRYAIYPHMFRKWFKTQLLSSGVPSALVDKMCGHGRYLSAQYELYSEEQLAQWYEKGESNLLIMEKPQQVDRLDVALDVALQMAKQMGISHEDVEKRMALKAGNLDANIGGGMALEPRGDVLKEGKELMMSTALELVREKLSGLNRRAIVMDQASEKQKVIQEQEVEKYLSDGWRFVSLMGNGQM